MDDDSASASFWMNPDPWGKRFLKVPTDAIHELGLVRANVLIAVLNRLPASPYGLSMTAVAGDLNMSWSQVRRHLQALEERGYIVVEREIGKRFCIRPSVTTHSKMLGVTVQNARGAQIQTPSNKLHVKEEKERSQRTGDDSLRSAKGASPPLRPPNEPGKGQGRTEVSVAMIADAFGMPRLPSSLPIAAHVEQPRVLPKQKPLSAEARAAGFVRLGGKGPRLTEAQQQMSDHLKGL